MNVDIRLPIGGMFSIIGLLLIVYGLMTTGDADLYARSLGINMNLWWGLVMLVFGGSMFHYGRRAKSRNVAKP
jgi:uncharacterized membrane protein